MSKVRRILIATGGTGGHIYPAMVTAQELRRRGWEVMFVGAFGPAAAKLTAEGFLVRELQVKGFVSRTPLQICQAGWLMIKAFFQCLAVIRQFRPEVVLGFGGYSSVAAVIGAAVLRVRAMIHEQNACPGEANRLLARVVRRIAVSFRDSTRFFPEGKVVLTGCPVRLMSTPRSRAEILRSFSLNEGLKTILVFGGSQGSRAINRAFTAFLGTVSSGAGIQVIHLAGKGAAEALQPVYGRFPSPFFLRDQIDTMADAYAVADVVVGRSGAGTVTELGLQGIPGVLIPYPHAKSHQTANAEVLERRGVAVIIQEKDLNPAALGAKIFLALSSSVTREERIRRLNGDMFSDAVRRLSDEVEAC